MYARERYHGIDVTHAIVDLSRRLPASGLLLLHQTLRMTTPNPSVVTTMQEVKRRRIRPDIIHGLRTRIMFFRSKQVPVIFFRERKEIVGTRKTNHRE